MRYTLENGKIVNISDKDIENKMKLFELTKEEAIQLWLEDNDYLVNEELEELDAKAKKVKIDHGAQATKPRKKSEKPRTVKTSDEKKALFESILTNLDRCIGVERENIQILKENKLISCTINDKVFKIDIIETRQKKES